MDKIKEREVKKEVMYNMLLEDLEYAREQVRKTKDYAQIGWLGEVENLRSQLLSFYD